MNGLDIGQLVHQHFGIIGGLVLMVAGPFIFGQLKKLAAAIPRMILDRIRQKWRVVVDSGKVDPSTQKLFQVLSHALFEWAQAEFPNVSGPEKMDQIVKAAAAAPYLGYIVRGNEDKVRQLLEIEFAAWKSVIDEGAKPDAPPAA